MSPGAGVRRPFVGLLLVVAACNVCHAASPGKTEAQRKTKGTGPLRARARRLKLPHGSQNHDWRRRWCHRIPAMAQPVEYRQALLAALRGQQQQPLDQRPLLAVQPHRGLGQAHKLGLIDFP